MERFFPFDGVDECFMNRQVMAIVAVVAPDLSCWAWRPGPGA
jgi:hypothetical protein